MRHLPFPASLALFVVVLALAAGPATAQPKLGSTKDVASALQGRLSTGSATGRRDDFGIAFRLSAGVAYVKRGKHARALAMFRPLADQGLAEAQYNLGLMYSAGLGVAQDDAEAARWFGLSAAQGFAPAIAIRSLADQSGGGVQPPAPGALGSIVVSNDQSERDVQPPAPGALGLIVVSNERSERGVQPPAPGAKGADETPTAVSVAEWREVLSGEPATDENMLMISSSYDASAAALLKSGDLAGGLHKALIKLVLSRHVLDRKARRAERLDRKATKELNEFQILLNDNGVGLAVMQQSASNLAAVLKEKPSSMIIKPLPGPRPATAAERLAMQASIKKTLFDPTSPIFGSADVFGDMACFTVNAKNRFGAYTGDKEIVLSFENTTKSWVAGGGIQAPHNICIATLTSQD